MSPDEFFDGYPTARAGYDRTGEMLTGIGPFHERITKSQVAFRRRRGFAYLWMPGRCRTVTRWRSLFAAAPPTRSRNSFPR